MNCEWVRDSNGDYLEGIPQTHGGWFSAAADIIPVSSSTGPRQELSVAYNSYANRFTMMMLNLIGNQIELWQSPSIIGPWTRVSGAADDKLPTGTPVGVYAPYMSEAHAKGAGRENYFLLSEWFDVYNVGVWRFLANRATVSNCTLTP
jgi:hypothetical protein